MTGVAITGNTIESTVAEGLILGYNTYVSSATYLISDVTVTGNTFRNIATSGPGRHPSGRLRRVGSHAGTPGWADVSITGNAFYGFTATTGFGIYAQAGSNLQIMANTFDSWKAVRGINIGDNSSSTSRPVTGFQVIGNTIDMAATTASAPIGVFIIDSTKGVVEGNTIIGPGTGVTNCIGILPDGISTAPTGCVFNNNVITAWQYAVDEQNNGAQPDYNTYVGNNCHGNANFITISGTHNLPTSGNTATLNVVA